MPIVSALPGDKSHLDKLIKRYDKLKLGDRETKAKAKGKPSKTPELTAELAKKVAELPTWRVKAPEQAALDFTTKEQPTVTLTLQDLIN